MLCIFRVTINAQPPLIDSTKIIGPIASLDQIQWVNALPKTRSGKIMRRILRKIAEKIKGIQSGKVQQYAVYFLVSVIGLAVIFIYLWNSPS